jgi:hypothetical protein
MFTVSELCRCIAYKWWILKQYSILFHYIFSLCHLQHSYDLYTFSRPQQHTYLAISPPLLALLRSLIYSTKYWLHRVDRMPGFFPVVRIGSPRPQPASEFPPPFGSALAAALLHCDPTPKAVLSLSLDASYSHVGGVCYNSRWECGWQPLAFFSKKLSSAKLASIPLLTESIISGFCWKLLTNHKPLVAAMTRLMPPQSACQKRHLAYVSETTTDLSHTPGSANVVVDASFLIPTFPR